MKKKGRKDHIGYKNKLRKRQKERENSEDTTTEVAGVSEEIANRLKHKVSEINGLEPKFIRDNNLERMSDIIVDYAEPFLKAIRTETKAEYEKAILIAITYWNCSILEDSSKVSRNEIGKMLKPITPDAESKSVANYMLERKRMMYPDNKRIIMSYELTELAGGGFHLSVASTLDETTIEKYAKNMTGSF